MEESSLTKFMIVCAGLQLQDLVPADDSLDLEVTIQLACEKARLATWLNSKRTSDTPAVALLRFLAEAELAQKGVQSGPFGSDTSFVVPSLNVFIQHAK